MVQYKIIYEFPKEEQILALPMKVLQQICKKNGLKTYGTKDKIWKRLKYHWDQSCTGGDGVYEWIQEENPIPHLESIDIIKRGNVQSSLCVLDVSTKNVCIPVFGHDYQVE